MNTTNQPAGSTTLTTETNEILKTDVLGRTRMSRAQREVILDAFEASGMTGQGFALQHGIKIQTFASWIQKRRRVRGDYHKEAVRQKLRMRKEVPANHPHNATPPPLLNLIEVDLRRDTTASTALEVLLPGGAIIRVSHESQISLLQLLLRQLPC